MGTEVSAILQQKGHSVICVAPDDTIDAVVRVLTQNRIGAAPVLTPSRQLAGIISERDIVRGIAELGEAVLKVRADTLMTRDVRTCAVEDDLVELMQVMTTKRFRHLPVMKDGALDGIVSIGDVVKQRLEEIQHEVEALRDYITRP
jgi:CBS domain-containing protein